MYFKKLAFFHFQFYFFKTKKYCNLKSSLIEITQKKNTKHNFQKQCESKIKKIVLSHRKKSLLMHFYLFCAFMEHSWEMPWNWYWWCHRIEFFSSLCIWCYLSIIYLYLIKFIILMPQEMHIIGFMRIFTIYKNY